MSDVRNPQRCNVPRASCSYQQNIIAFSYLRVAAARRRLHNTESVRAEDSRPFTVNAQKVGDVGAVHTGGGPVHVEAQHLIVTDDCPRPITPHDTVPVAARRVGDLRTEPRRAAAPRCPAGSRDPPSPLPEDTAAMRRHVMAVLRTAHLVVIARGTGERAVLAQATATDPFAADPPTVGTLSRQGAVTAHQCLPPQRQWSRASSSSSSLTMHSSMLKMNPCDSTVRSSRDQ